MHWDQENFAFGHDMKSGDFDIAIIGPGKAGTALGALYQKNGGRVTAVGGRNLKKTEEAAKIIGGKTKALDIFEAAGLADRVILSVSDCSIESVCREIALKGKFRREAVVAHCSGVLDGSALDAARSLCGCRAGSMHPLQTFPTVEAAVDRLPEAYCFYEGDEKAVAFFKHFAEVAGMKPVPVSGKGKALYHAAATTACNHLVSLMDAALETAGLAGIEASTAWKAFEPLIKATLKNIGELGPVEALTGPMARGDISTVKLHLAALENENPSLGTLYRALGTRTASIAAAKRSITAEQHKELTEIISKYSDQSG